MISARLAPYFDDYAASHRTRGNEICHLIGVPMIAVGLIGLLALAALGRAGELVQLDLGALFVAAVVAWYVRLDWTVGVPFALVALGLYFAGRASSLPVLVALFVLGWVFQLIGHARFERKRPAFLSNARHIVIGPLWIFARLVGAIS